MSSTAEPLGIPDDLPVLPLRDIVVYPSVTVSLSVSRPKSIRALERAASTGQLIGLISQREPEVEDPAAGDLYGVATVGIVLRKLKLPDDRVRALVQGVARVSVRSVEQSSEVMTACLDRIEVPEPEPSLEVEALMKSVTSNVQRLVTLGKSIPAETLVIVGNIKEPGRLADQTASLLDLKVPDAQELLELLDPMTRLRRANELLSRELELLFMQKEITNQAREEMGRSQREYFLRQQLKAIQRELGEVGDLAEEIAELREKARRAGLPADAAAEVERALSRLERMPAESSETASVRSYLEWMVALPWRTSTRDRLDLVQAKVVLDQDHHGLVAVKERLLEHLAVLKLRRRAGRGKPRGPILCLVGPPGVGKTSLGRSIARTLGRRFARISLGGVRDEAEIRGHRRTYVGSMPGRIIQSLRQCGSRNPVLMLDEVDKMGADSRGDPASALLEVLDPEQNHAFRDHYLGVGFDLSGVMFIATANLLDPIPPAFRDRLEVIRIPGYTTEEKLAIARSHLMPRQLLETGLSESTLAIDDEALRVLIHGYTKEAGLRGLDREIGALCRKVAREIASGGEVEKEPRARLVGSSSLTRYLGPARFLEEELLRRDSIGVAAGLALTAAGGEVLFVETTLMPGRGELLLTGQLGEVMRESAQAALSYIRARADQLGIPKETFSTHDIHVHLPAGATPKDGPSAGVTLVAALVSALSKRPVDRTLAMTGEITLRGDVLAIGGVREKLLAARRAGARTVLLPDRNAKELSEIPVETLSGIDVRKVGTIDEVLALALLPPCTEERAAKSA